MIKQVITKEIEIDIGHRIPNHESKCRNPHGHRLRVEVGVYGEVINKKGASDEGMVIDFGDIKKIMIEEIDIKHDHGFMISDTDEIMLKAFDKIIKIKYVKIWETPTSSAFYEE